MRLLVILLAWVLRRQLDVRHYMEPDGWQRRLIRRLAGAGSGRTGVQLYLVQSLYVLGVIVVALGTWGLGGWMGGLWATAIALAMLLCATGMPGWREPLALYSEAWNRGDMQSAWHHVSHLLPTERRGEALSPDSLHLQLAESLINTTFERYFLPIFWYAVLGPAGLLLMLGALAIRRHHPTAAVQELFERWVELLAWVPARLLGFSFGIAGDLSGWLQEQKAEARVPGERRPALLLRAANGALSSYALDPRRFEHLHPDSWQEYGGRSLAAVRDLLNRSMLVWIAVLALLAIMGLLP